MNEMVAGAQKRAAGQADAPLLPLVRLRVDYTGFSTINAQRFGQRFVGRVANPHDLLLFQKAPARKPKVRSYVALHMQSGQLQRWWLPCLFSLSPRAKALSASCAHLCSPGGAQQARSIYQLRQVPDSRLEKRHSVKPLGCTH